MRGTGCGMGFGLPRLKCLPAEPAARFPCDSPETRVRLALLSCRSLVARQPRRGDPADASAALLPTTLPSRSAPGSTPQRREKSDFLSARRAVPPLFPRVILSPRGPFPVPFCGPTCETTPQELLLLSLVIEINFQICSATQESCAASRGRTSQRRTTDAQH